MTQLGTAGPMVSTLGLGTMTFGAETGPAEAHRMLDTYAAAGGTLLDCADVYADGRSEEIVGTWPGARDGVLVATKGRFPVTGQPGASLRAGYLRGALDASLRRLRRDAVDIYQAHGPDRGIAMARGDPDGGPREEPRHHHAVVTELVTEKDLRAVHGELVAGEGTGELRTWSRSLAHGRHERLAVDRDPGREHEAREMPETALRSLVRGASDLRGHRYRLHEGRRVEPRRSGLDLEAVTRDQDHGDSVG